MTSPPVVTTRKETQISCFATLTTNLSTTGSANLSFAHRPAPSKLPHVVSKQRHWGCWGSGMAFSPFAPLTSLSLPTELTNFACWCPKRKGSCWHRASPGWHLWSLPTFCTGAGDRHRPSLSPSPAGCIIQPIALQ